MKSHRTALVWFRRDLRLVDNPALSDAAQQASRVIPVFIFAPDEERPWAPGAASRWWLHHSLTALEQSLRKRGSKLIVRRGPTPEILHELIAHTGATLVAWNRLYEPAVLARDAKIVAALERNDIAVAQHNAALLFEPGAILNGSGAPYRVFTPFWRAVERELPRLPAPAKAPRRLGPVPRRLPSLAIHDLDLLPRIAWDSGLARDWSPGEAGALRQLARFRRRLRDYDDGRNRPDEALTSRLSAHLHFGEIGPRQVLASIHSHAHGAADARSLTTYVRQIVWREFAHQLLFHFPETPEQPLDARFAQLRWSRSRKYLRAWQRGLTGYPIVDAGMRQLWHTGWMHNRVRMIAASLLTKNLQTHWLAGAQWFWDTLVDADLANNTLGWQWTAGCGADAAPYYRIFNPVLQTERFDPQRRYLRRWLPELAQLPDRWIHQPWAAPPEILAAAGVRLGRFYPRQIVDFRESRKRALAAYAAIRRG